MHRQNRKDLSPRTRRSLGFANNPYNNPEALRQQINALRLAYGNVNNTNNNIPITASVINSEIQTIASAENASAGNTDRREIRNISKTVSEESASAASTDFEPELDSLKTSDNVEKVGSATAQDGKRVLNKGSEKAPQGNEERQGAERIPRSKTKELLKMKEEQKLWKEEKARKERSVRDWAELQEKNKAVSQAHFKQEREKALEKRQSQWLRERAKFLEERETREKAEDGTRLLVLQNEYRESYSRQLESQDQERRDKERAEGIRKALEEMKEDMRREVEEHHKLKKERDELLLAHKLEFEQQEQEKEEKEKKEAWDRLMEKKKEVEQWLKARRARRTAAENATQTPMPTPTSNENADARKTQREQTRKEEWSPQTAEPVDTKQQQPEEKTKQEERQTGTKPKTIDFEKLGYQFAEDKKRQRREFEDKMLITGEWEPRTLAQFERLKQLKGEDLSRYSPAEIKSKYRDYKLLKGHWTPDTEYEERRLQELRRQENTRDRRSSK